MDTLKEVRKALRRSASQEKAIILSRFFKTGKGEYGEGDRFLGVTVPEQRRVAKEFRERADRATVVGLLDSPIHEERLTALFLLTHLFERGMMHGGAGEWVKLYLSKTDRVNNWDLVDSSAYQILGRWLEGRDRSVLHRMARSESLWENRIAVVATLHFIRKGDLSDILSLTETMLMHPHDLMHKATGWMLREAWKRDSVTVEGFLDEHAVRMPRTMLRYAIERMPEDRRKTYLRRPFERS
jgi:3-methyladenine DNA glycosylase AlkD